MIRRAALFALACFFLASIARAQTPSPQTPDPNPPPSKVQPTPSAPPKTPPAPIQQAAPPQDRYIVVQPVSAQEPVLSARYVPVQQQAPPVPVPVYGMQGPQVQVQQMLMAGPTTTTSGQFVLGGGPISLSCGWLGRQLITLSQPKVITWTKTHIAITPTTPVVGQAYMTTIAAPAPTYQVQAAAPVQQVTYQLVPVANPIREAAPPPPIAPSPQSNSDAVHKFFGSH